jgi:hypothetical protein
MSSKLPNSQQPFTAQMQRDVIRGKKNCCARENVQGSLCLLYFNFKKQLQYVDERYGTNFCDDISSDYKSISN